MLPPIGPSVHTIAIDQNYGQHVILAQHCPGRVPAGLCPPVFPVQLDLWSCCAEKPSLSAPESAEPEDTAQLRGGAGEGRGVKQGGPSSNAR